MLSVVLTYKYRYRVCTVLCRCRRLAGCECVKHKVIYTYDVFLSYCGEDRPWIMEQLLPNLEEKHGLRCCVHERDFPIMGALEDVIQCHMHRSRVLIIVISSVSIKKHWTMFELRIAKYMDMFRHKRVLYIKLDDLGSNIPSIAKSIFSGNIYNQWPESSDAKREELFWTKTVAAIHGDLDCCRCLHSYRHVTLQEDDTAAHSEI